MRLVQLLQGSRRFTGIVDGPNVRLLDSETVYSLAVVATTENRPLAEVAAERQTGVAVSYDELEDEAGGWCFLPCFDHPTEPSRCLVSGTGLTHESGAMNRNAMHAGASSEPLTDSLRMYRWGVESGRPAPGESGVAPEWFYKGTGDVLRGHLAPLTVPWHAEDGGEEPEIAGIYMIDQQGRPCRIGMAQGNEFSDHVHERRNYLYLAESKLRNCAVGPELLLDPDFGDVTGTVEIRRGGATVWTKEIRSGAAAMCHSLANIEHHHFKHAAHRRPGDAHVHFFGTGAFSFGDGVKLEEGDEMIVGYRGYGRPLRNRIVMETATPQLVVARRI